MKIPFLDLPALSAEVAEEVSSAWKTIVEDSNFVLGAATVILAMGEGRTAAASMNQMLAES
jgi:hypothetical protein